MAANEASPQTDELYRLAALFVGALPVRECCAPTEIDGLAPDVADWMLPQVLVDFDNDPATLACGAGTRRVKPTRCFSIAAYVPKDCSHRSCYTDAPSRGNGRPI
jgi:hypothetical protein